jgi:hypothetical protein
MPDGRRNREKLLRKDQQSVRDTREEVLEEIRSSDVQPLVKNGNRDRARGDWDRTGKHHDEEVGQSDESER